MVEGDAYRASVGQVRRVLVATLVLAAAVAAPNLIWLVVSTVRVDNVAGRSIDAVAYRACGRIHEIGTLADNTSVFRVLEDCGDDTLDVLVGGTVGCTLYVQGDMFHVDASIMADGRVDCTYADPFATLLVTRLL